MTEKFNIQDYLIAALIGFLSGTFFIPALLNVGLREYAYMFLALPWIFAPLFAGGLWVAQYFSRWITFLRQFGKFAAVGFLNTAIDFGTLNALSMFTGITGGLVIGGVNVPGFTLAVLNAYLWNKFWVFGAAHQTGGVFNDFPKFLVVSGTGLLVNSGMVIFLTTFVSVSFLSPALWLNISKVMATVFSLVWNFTGYKFIVFREASVVSSPVTPSEPKVDHMRAPL